MKKSVVSVMVAAALVALAGGAPGAGRAEIVTPFAMVGVHKGQEYTIVEMIDVVEYDLATHRLTMTEEALWRLRGATWWQDVASKAGVDSFRVLAGGEVIYTGEFFTEHQTREPTGGLKIFLPSGFKGRSLTIDLYHPAVDVRSDGRIIRALRREGVLVE
ncbi:MAG: hypothetical protein IPP62_09975 [bacterium]|jgi:hypothetical protein|nr:hypothetical protein [bacterium]